MFQERIETLYGSSPSKFAFPDRSVEAYRKIPLLQLSKYPFTGKGEEYLDLSQITKQAIALPMKEAKKTYALFIENRMKERLRSEKDYFAALSSAIYENGYFIYVPPGTVIEEPIPLIMNYSGTFSHFAPQIQVYIGKGASVKFVLKPQFHQFESGIVNGVVDLYLDRESKCQWIDESIIPEHALYINSVRASVKRESKLEFWSLTKGSNFFKQDLQVLLLEEGSEVSLKGAALLSEKNVSHTQVLIEHKAPNTKSRQHFKAVMKDKSSSTFEGKIFVEPEAQKTEAYQLNNNLLLGKESSVFCKPNLEIFADDVKASHGATVSRLSDEELFYLRTRGISKEEAGLYLSSGFLDEIIKDIPAWYLIQNW